MARWSVPVEFVVEADDEAGALIVAYRALRSLRERGAMPASATLGNLRDGVGEVREVTPSRGVTSGDSRTT